MSHAVEEGEPSLDSAAFRRCLGQFATGVTVVTTQVGEAIAGMTSNSFSAVSLDPPLILWSIKRSSHSFPIFKTADHFAVNVLAEDQVGLSQKFARSGPDKFSGVRWAAGRGGVPILDGVVATFECRHTADYDGGDHLVMVGQVERYCRYERQALIFAQGRYAVSADHPDLGPSLSGATENAAPGEADDLMTSLMRRAYNAMTSALEKARQLVGLTHMQTRLLRAIQRFPDRTLEGLLPELLFGENAAEDVLAEVISSGLVARDCGGTLRLTIEGEKCVAAVIEHARRIEAEEFKSISTGDVSAARRVLVQLSNSR